MDVLQKNLHYFRIQIVVLRTRNFMPSLISTMRRPIERKNLQQKKMPSYTSTLRRASAHLVIFILGNKINHPLYRPFCLCHRHYPRLQNRPFLQFCYRSRTYPLQKFLRLVYSHPQSNRILKNILAFDH